MSHVHLTLEERIVIELFVHMGMTCREIATCLGRSHTTISASSAESVGSSLKNSPRT